MHTYTSDVKLLIQFVKDQGSVDTTDSRTSLFDACKRIEYAIKKELNDYSFSEDTVTGD